jgi:apolipoprotein N-acyltransferase
MSALAGTLLFLGCADFDIWPLAWIGLLPLLWVLLDEEGQPRTERPFLYGYITGLFANGGGFYWIVGLLMRFGHLPFIAALPLFLLLIGYQALTFGLFATILCRLRRQVDVPVAWLSALVWVACELCVPYVFPWYLAITQAWVPPVIQIADLTGPLGVSFLLVLSNGALFHVTTALWSGRPLLRREGSKLLPPAMHPPILAALVIVLSLGYGVLRIHQVDNARAAAEKLKIGVVQANVGIQEKFVPGLREQQHELHLRLSQELSKQGAELIVWPESSYPYPLPRPFSHDFADSDMRQLQRGFQTPLLFGALTLERKDRSYVPYNTALLLDRGGQIRGSFDKNFLLIFGEYLPFASQLSFLRELIPEISNFARGTDTRTFPFDYHGRRYSLGPMICYEDIIPAFSRRLFSDANPPNLMINITNDAWFGATSEPYEHLALAVFRAVEHREDLVRAVNTGVSAFIDAAGRVYKKGPSVDPTLTPGVPPVTLLADAALLSPGGSYQRLGETFGGGCLILVLLLGLLARRRAGLPLYFAELCVCLLAFHGAVLIAALLLPGQGLFAAFYAALLHRGEAHIPEPILFQATWQLTLVLMLTAAGLGAWLGRHLLREAAHAAPAALGEEADKLLAPQAAPGRLELLLAIIATVVLPVVLFGRMEGNTGAVVILAGLAAVSGLFARRLSSRRAK